MMNAKKRLAIASVIATLSAGALGAGTVFAAQHGSGQQYGMSGLVQAISQKFHLAPNDVQAVIDQQRQQMTDQMHKKFADRLAASLTQAVKDGKLTQTQADAITAKQAELKTFEASLQGKSPTDRQAAMKAEHDALQQWATSNNIPSQYILPFKGGMMGGRGNGHGMPGRMQNWGRK